MEEMRKSSRQVLAVLSASGSERISDRMLMNMTGIKSLETITRAKKDLASKGYIQYTTGSPRLGTVYNIETNDKNRYKKSLQKIVTNGKSYNMLYEGKTGSAPPPPPQTGSIDDLTFLGTTPEEKLEELVKAWASDEQMPELYVRHVRIMRQYVLVDRTATAEQWLQAVYDAMDKNTPDTHHRGINFNFIHGQLKQALRKAAKRRAVKGETRDEFSTGKSGATGIGVGDDGEGIAISAGVQTQDDSASNSGSVGGAGQTLSGECGSDSGAVQTGCGDGQEVNQQHNLGRRGAEALRELQRSKLRMLNAQRQAAADRDKLLDEKWRAVCNGRVPEVQSGAVGGEHAKVRTAAEILGRYFGQSDSGRGQRTGNSNGGQALGDV